jgi:hypothetical protein
MDNKIRDLLDRLDNANNIDERKIILRELKELKKGAHISESAFYPDRDDPHFNDKLISHSELAMNRYKLDDKLYGKRKDIDIFELQYHQRFLKKLISPETPYRSIYLYHGVGVGKTCASLQIANNFNGYFKNGQRTLILSRTIENTQIIFRKEIFNRDMQKLPKNKYDTYNNCLGNYYLDKIKNWRELNEEELESEFNKLIKQDFEFMGLQKLVSIITNIKDEARSSGDFIKRIKAIFDNRVIIIDEVHNMRKRERIETGTGASKDHNPLTEFKNNVLNNVDNTVLVLLSATPMYDRYDEILNIMDLMLLHDKKPGVSKEFSGGKGIFNDNGTISAAFMDKLAYVSSRYISYMRGEDPFHFPIRLDPRFNNDKNIILMKHYPRHDIITHREIKPDEHIRYLCLSGSILTRDQEAVYYSQLKTIVSQVSNIENAEDMDDIIEDSEDSRNGGYLLSSIQMSNILYPPIDSELYDSTGKISTRINFRELCGKGGFENIFTRSTSGNTVKIQYKRSALDKYGPVLAYDKIGLIAPKMRRILDYIINSQGIVLVYSNYLDGGIIPMAIALEHIGMNRRGSDNFLRNNPQIDNKIVGNYAIISGDPRYNKDKDRYVNEASSSKNKNGDIIKVLLITKSASEGLDLKNIREIHIMEPWYNLNLIEQTIGRGVRRNSHIMLDEKYRNTTIYLHAAMTADRKIESIDYRIYRYAEMKQLKISAIEREIKRNAIDCNLNSEILIYNSDIPKLRKTLVSSQGIQRDNEPISDKDGSRICDYKLCNFDCARKYDDSKVDKRAYNIKTLAYEIDLMKQYIVKYFRNKLYATWNMLVLDLDIKHPDILRYALDDMIKNKTRFNGNMQYDSKLQIGYLIYRSNKYIFQPINDIPEIIDERMTIAERQLIKRDIATHLDVDTLEPYSYLSDIKNSSINIDINYIFETQKDQYNIGDWPQYTDYIYDIIIDAMDMDTLDQLYRGLFLNKLNAENEKYVKRSLDKIACIIYDNNKIDAIYNHYKRSYVIYNSQINELENCSVALNSTYMRRFNAKNAKYARLLPTSPSLRGYIYIKDDIMPVFKMRSDSAGPGTVCVEASRFKNISQEYISKYDNEIIKSINSKHKKRDICILYEAVLRKIDETSARPLFVRPQLWHVK